MRRKRKTRYQWLENLGSVGAAALPDDSTSGRDFGTLIVNTNGTSSWRVVPLLPDEPSDDAVAPVTMVNSFQYDYFIKRIVGKIFVNYNEGNNTAVPACLATFGIFVARCDDEQAGTGFNTAPVGTGSFAGSAAAVNPAAGITLNGTLNYSPINTDAIREPWIWRRQWVLGNGIVSETKNIGPKTNMEYGSVADGPHIDAKTARRVRDDERLFGIFAVRSYPINSTYTIPTVCRAFLDYRVLGSPRKHRQRGAF